MHKYTFTIFTPCYNSATFINRVYEGLQRQTFRDFEWLVVDDASTDRTVEILEEFRQNANFPVRIVALEANAMISVAYNIGLDLAEGEFFIPIGHDDSMTPDALEKLNAAWNAVPANERARLAGVTCNCQNQYGELVGTAFPSSPWITDIFTMRHNLKVKGEKWGANKTSLMREHPFSTFDRYVPESLVWYNIGATYKSVFINDMLRIYYVNQPNHVSLSSDTKIRYVRGFHYFHKFFINNYLQRVLLDPEFTIRTLLYYVRMGKHSGKSAVELLGEIESPWKKALVALSLPGGLLLAWRDRAKGRVAV